MFLKICHQFENLEKLVIGFGDFKVKLGARHRRSGCISRVHSSVIFLSILDFTSVRNSVES